MVAAKANAARRAGLLAIICIGETQSQRKDGTAYEPLWAIGSGHTPDPNEIVQMHAHIRQCLAARLGAEGRMVRILYGGSVTPANAREILALPEVAGARVGGASLKAADFDAIVRAVDPSEHP